MSNLDCTRVAVNEEFIRLFDAAGPTRALEMLHDRYSNRLSSYVRRLLFRGQCYDPPDHSVDVGQEAWFRAFRAVHRCNQSPVGWLYRIARNVSFDHLKDCGLEKDRAAGQPSSPEEEDLLYSLRPRLYSHEEAYLRRLALRQAMSRLLPVEQQVLWLRIEGHSHEEIAVIMNISSVYARQLSHRAKRHLQLIAGEEA